MLRIQIPVLPVVLTSSSRQIERGDSCLPGLVYGFVSAV